MRVTTVTHSSPIEGNNRPVIFNRAFWSDSADYPQRPHGSPADDEIVVLNPGGTNQTGRVLVGWCRWISAPFSSPMLGKRSAARARAFAVSSSRSRGGALVTRESNSSRAASVTRSTARTKAGSLTLEGRVNPLSFLTNWRADARISVSVADGLKL